MPHGLADSTVASQLPDPGDAVFTAGDEHAAVRAERDRAHRLLMGQRVAGALERLHVPQLRRIVVGSRGQQRVVGAERNRPDVPSMLHFRAQRPSSGTLAIEHVVS